MPKSHTVQTVILVSESKLIDVQNFLMNLLAQENQQTLKLTELSLLAVKSAPLQQIINATSDLLNDPVIVVDNAYKVISSSTNYDVADPLWKKIIMDGYAPYSLLIEINRIVTNSNPDDRLAPFYVKCDLSPVHKLAIKLMFDNHDIGYIVMFNKPTEIGPQHWSMLPKIANILSEVISKTSKFREMYGDMRNRILESMMDNNNRQRIRTLMQSDNIVAPRQCTAVVAKMNPNITEQEIRYYAEQVKSAYLQSYYNHQGDYVYLILPVENTLRELRSIKDMAQSLKLTVMVSETYRDFFETPRYLKLCKQALDVAQTIRVDQHFDYCSKYTDYLILNNVVEPNLLNFCENAYLSVLKKYDANNKTELIETLNAYFDHNRSLKETAEAPFIHRNTLANRMARITKTANIDFSDSNQMFNLELSLRIEKLLAGQAQQAAEYPGMKV